MAKANKPRTGRELPTTYKLAAVQERLRGTREEDVAKAFGVSAAAVAKWMKRFKEAGPAGLESRRAVTNAARRKAANPVKHEQVVALKREHEDWGSRRISDILARFEALGVSEQQVRRILHDEGLVETPKLAKPREHEPRRFERATPNQLWQSDIFTFRLRRAERLYVCVFMDDHSRFIVGHALAHHQKSGLVMEALERGLAAYGQPAEVLTDNGRQYTVWRGKTEFEETLHRMGIDHIRSRPQHPQTLGKVERFWKTLWDEFLGRTVFAHAVDAQYRLEHFLSHYNFQRPHQALDGLVPADRFFKAAAHVRAEIERAVQANELRLALEQPPRKPFYVVGQLGDQRLSISASENGLDVHLGDKSEHIPLKETTDGTSTVQRVESTQESSDTEMAREPNGPRLDRTQPRTPGALGDLRREAGNDGDRGSADLARLLLPTRDQGDQRDAAGAGPGRRWRFEPGRDGAAQPDQAAGGQAREGGGRTAAGRADALPATEADAWAGEDASWPAAEPDNLLDAGWAEKLALLDDDEADEGQVEPAQERDDEPVNGFDPELGWRERGPERWERKLAGGDAPSDNLSDGEGPTAGVHPSPRATDRSGTATPLRGDRGSTGTNPDRDGRGELARAVEESLPDDPASGARRDDRGDHAEAGGSSGETGARAGAREGERGATGGERGSEGSLGDAGASDERGRWDRFWEDPAAAIAGKEDQTRGPRTGSDPDEGGGDA